jgi:hypothetical protein
MGATYHIGEVGGYVPPAPSASFTRPADTTAYASGDLVANSTTAASVVPMSIPVARTPGGSLSIRRAKLKKSGTSTTNASFRLHIYTSDPSASSGITNGDNGAWATKESSYLGAFDVTVDRVFSDAAVGFGVPIVGGELTRKLSANSQYVFALLEARAAYTPSSAEVFTVELDVFGN